MKKSIATREAYGQALAELGGLNPNVVVLDADLSKSTRTDIFAARFPGRFFDMGVAEQNMMGTAAGLALAGKIPFASSFAVFATGRAFEQVRNSICHARLNVKIAASHAGITVGEDGASHQSVEDIAIMRALPHISVLVPADWVQTKAMVQAAAEHTGPVYLRLGRLAVPQVYPEEHQFVWGRADVLREGGDATIVGCGLMVYKALEAADALLAEGIKTTVINMGTIKPLDVETLLYSAKATGAVVSVEEHTTIGGLGGAIAEVLGEQLPLPLKRVGIADSFGESGKPEELLAEYGLDPGSIAAAVREAIAMKKRC